MLNLSKHLVISKVTIESSNLCDVFEKSDRDQIGNWVWECFDRDAQSRETWYRRNEAAMDLALQVQKIKTFPWQGCSNIAFPLVTIAALQFHARAYPTIVNGRKVVSCRVVGLDTDGSQAKRADRIAEHMSWQLLEQDVSWEEEQDRALINIPIVGTAFKKTYYDASKGHNVSRLVLAKDLVIDYWAKSVEDAATKTHIVPMYRNEVHERIMRGTFEDVTNDVWYQEDARPFVDPNKHRDEKRAGTSQPEGNANTPFTMLEQHCWLDLDGDGYAEPYIATIEESTRTLMRLVTRFDRIEDVEFDNSNRIVKIDPTEYFTKIPFIPSPDGSIMDIGFGTLLGPLNESTNSAINQLFDAGTLANTAGGFLGRGAKIRGGIYTFNPFEWNRVDSTGDDLRKNIFPLPVREPSAVMFQLLGLLIDYTNRISGATDMLTGVNPGQNTPAETSRSMVEQGQKVYSAIFKRVWRSLKQEYKKLYVLNSIWLPETTTYGTAGAQISREDYTAGAAAVLPVADPTITSDAAAFAQAQLVREAAKSSGGYDADAVERLYLETLKVPDVDRIFPGSDKVPQGEDVKITLMKMKLEADSIKLEFEKQKFAMTLQNTQNMNNAKIQELQAKSFKLMEEGKAEPEKNRINAYNAAIQAMREENKQINTQIETMLEYSRDGSNNTISGGVRGLEAPTNDSASTGLGLPAS